MNVCVQVLVRKAMNVCVQVLVRKAMNVCVQVLVRKAMNVCVQVQVHVYWSSMNGGAWIPVFRYSQTTAHNNY